MWKEFVFILFLFVGDVVILLWCLFQLTGPATSHTDAHDRGHLTLVSIWIQATPKNNMQNNKARKETNEMKTKETGHDKKKVNETKRREEKAGVVSPSLPQLW